MFLGTVQVFNPSGFDSTSGTPNYLLLLDDYVRSVEVSWIPFGGLNDATFTMYNVFENVTDMLSNNLIVFGCGGGYLDATVPAGVSSITVNSLYNDNGDDETYLDIVGGEYILITD